MIMDRIKLQKEFRQMVKDFDGEKAHNNVAGSVCEHYAIEFAIQQVKNCSIPHVSVSLFNEALRVLRDLAEHQNGAPLIRHEKEYNETMHEVWDFLEANET